MTARSLAVGLAVLSSGAARADVKLHPLFADHAVLQRDVAVPVWGTAAAGQAVTVTLAGAGDPVTATATADADGRWRVELPARKAATGATLTVAGGDTVELKNLAVGDVWVCSGQSNMEWPVNAAYDADKVKAGARIPDLRLFTVRHRPAAAPLAAAAVGDLGHLSGWAVSGPGTVGGFSAVGYHFGAAVHKAVKVPVGLVHTSWGGTPAEAWASTDALAADPALKHYAAAGAGKKLTQNSPSALFNGMVSPLLPFPVKGVIWYQGESNVGRAAEYRTLFPALIADWRARWNRPDLPFLFVQLAPWIHNGADDTTYAELRDAQRHTSTTVPHTGMAVVTDAGDLFDIHPRDKATVGSRLALLARELVYGQPVAGRGPTFRELTVDGDKAVLHFDHVGGGLVGKYGQGQLKADGPLAGFELAGDDGAFVPAKAHIAGDTVVVTSDRVPKPAAVRFGFKNYPVVNLFSKAGVPASPFRTSK